MSAHVLLNLLHMLRKRDKCSASFTFDLFSPTHLINLIKHEHSCKILYILYCRNFQKASEYTITYQGSHIWISELNNLKYYLSSYHPVPLKKFQLNPTYKVQEITFEEFQDKIATGLSFFSKSTFSKSTFSKILSGIPS